jgi:adenine-specific DNA-methyltransferase
MDSVETEFFQARSRALLSCSDAALLLEVSLSDIKELDSGIAQPPPRLLAALNGFHRASTGLQSESISKAQLNLPIGEIETSARTRKSELGQFFTPKPIADYMASLFSQPTGNVQLLDAGAGEGALTSAFVTKWQGSLGTNRIVGCAFECDEQVLVTLRNQLSSLTGGGCTVMAGDFLENAVIRLKDQSSVRFSHAILNPPYKKIGMLSSHRAAAREVGFETVNLYSAFVGAALALLKNGGELVAIIPRSFCNGPYYEGFRKFVLGRSSLKHIHVFGKRNEAFASDRVLQENVILKLVAAEQQGPVVVSRSSDHRFTDYVELKHPFSDIVAINDKQMFVHIPTTEALAAREFNAAMEDLTSLNLTCSTGPIVDFRVKEALRPGWVEGSVPLLYPAHFSTGQLIWPKPGFKKSNAIDNSIPTKSSLWPAGYYTVVRRFSSKEERRRVYASVVESQKLPEGMIGFENHLNVFHNGKKPIEVDIAWGLAAYLNSTRVDDQLRSFSGHTQVNATDLRKLRYPKRVKLERIGKWYACSIGCDQKTLDTHIEMFLQ